MQNLITLFNTNAAPVALGKMLAQAMYHGDEFMVDCLKEEIRDVIETVAFLEACLEKEMA